MYKLIISKKAKSFFKKLDKPVKERIFKKLVVLEKNPEIGIPLTGNLTGFWKLRIGDYRAIYEIKNEKLLIYVLRLGHRKNIYD